MKYTWKLCFCFFNINQILGFKNRYFHKVNEKIESDFNIASIRSSQYLTTNFLSRSKFTNERGHFALGGLTSAKMTNEKRFNFTIEFIN